MDRMAKFGNDLYTGARSYNFVGRRKIWYAIAAVMILASIVIPAIRGGFVTIGVGVAMLALPLGADAPALVGLVVVGLGCAPIYPAIIHSTPVNFGRDRSQAVIGIQMAAAYTGSTLAPPLFGVVSTWVGMWTFPLFLAVLAVLGLLMSERLNKLVGRRAPVDGLARRS